MVAAELGISVVKAWDAARRSQPLVALGEFDEPERHPLGEAGALEKDGHVGGPLAQPPPSSRF